MLVRFGCEVGWYYHKGFSGGVGWYYLKGEEVQPFSQFEGGLVYFKFPGLSGTGVWSYRVSLYQVTLINLVTLINFFTLVTLVTIVYINMAMQMMLMILTLPPDRQPVGRKLQCGCDCWGELKIFWQMPFTNVCF